MVSVLCFPLFHTPPDFSLAMLMVRSDSAAANAKKRGVSIVMSLIVMQHRVPDLASEIEQKPGALKASELAEILGFGHTAIYEMAAAKRIPHLRIGSSIRFGPHAIARWLREHSIEAA